MRPRSRQSHLGQAAMLARLKHPNLGVLVFLVLGILSFSLAAFAQTHVHQQPSQQVTAISGKEHPELISDQEAITVFFLAIMEPPRSGSKERLRFEAKLGRMQLTSPDALVKTVADRSRSNAARMEAQQRRIEVVANIDALAQSSYEELVGGL